MRSVRSRKELVDVINHVGFSTKKILDAQRQYLGHHTPSELVNKWNDRTIIHPVLTGMCGTLDVRHLAAWWYGISVVCGAWLASSCPGAKVREQIRTHSARLALLADDRARLVTDYAALADNAGPNR
jgi:hypothetical protein